MRRRLAVAGGAVAVAAVAVVGLAARSHSHGADWAEVKREDLVLRVDVTGTLKAVNSEVIGPPMVAEIWDFKIAFMAPEGSRVRKGQPVVGFDQSALVRELQDKQAEQDTARTRIEQRQGQLDLAREDLELQLAEAEAGLRKAKLKLDRPDDLVPVKEVLTTRLDLEQAEKQVAALREKLTLTKRSADAELDALRAAERRAAARVSSIQQGITRMTVVAPRDGSVVYSTNWRDEKKKVGDTCWRAEKVMEIPDTTLMYAKGEVDEEDAGRLALGQRVTLRLDAFPDVEYAGRLRVASRSFERRSWQNPARIARVDIDLDRTDPERMRPGMRFRGHVEVGRVPHVLVVPADAIRLGAGGPTVMRKGVTGTSAVAVTLGRRNDALVEIVGGIDEGDRVLRGGEAAQ